jgi:hypothetical protein
MADIVDVGVSEGTFKTLVPFPFRASTRPAALTAANIDVPWSSFQRGDYGRIGEFRPALLKSLAIVAAKKDFDALIEVREIGLY